VLRKIFNSTIVKANWYFKYMGLYSVKVDICCWVLGSLPMWRKGPKFEKPMSHLNLVERRL